jgi:hypothetical protein
MYTEFAQFNVALLLVLGNTVFFFYRVIDVQMPNSGLLVWFNVRARTGGKPKLAVFEKVQT